MKLKLLQLMFGENYKSNLPDIFWKEFWRRKRNEVLIFTKKTGKISAIVISVLIVWGFLVSLIYDKVSYFEQVVVPDKTKLITNIITTSPPVPNYVKFNRKLITLEREKQINEWRMGPFGFKYPFGLSEYISDNSIKSTAEFRKKYEVGYLSIGDTNITYGIKMKTKFLYIDTLFDWGDFITAMLSILLYTLLFALVLALLIWFVTWWLTSNYDKLYKEKRFNKTRTKKRVKG